MTFPVEFRTDDALFRLRLDGVTLNAPDSFRPVVGGRIDVDVLAPAESGESASEEVATVDLYVTGVEWRLRNAATGAVRPQYDLVMRVTLSSEAPAAPARTHSKKK